MPSYDWAKIESARDAHYATIFHHSSTHVDTVKFEWIISVYDAAGTLARKLTHEVWD